MEEMEENSQTTEWTKLEQPVAENETCDLTEKTSYSMKDIHK